MKGRVGVVGWSIADGGHYSISGHRLAVCRVQNRDSLLVKDERSAAMPRNQPKVKCACSKAWWCHKKTTANMVFGRASVLPSRYRVVILCTVQQSFTVLVSVTQCSACFQLTTVWVLSGQSRVSSTSSIRRLHCCGLLSKTWTCLVIQTSSVKPRFHCSVSDQVGIIQAMLPLRGVRSGGYYSCHVSTARCLIRWVLRTDWTSVIDYVVGVTLEIDFTSVLPGLYCQLSPPWLDI